MKFVMAVKTYFGQKEGQTLQGFGKEISALSFDEKKELAEMLSVELGTEVTVSEPS